MVSPHSPDADDGQRTGRGQLLLIGAIGIAVIIIGITVVINSVLLTENTATTEALQSGEQIGRFDTAAQDNMRSIVLRLNHRDRNLTSDQLTTYIHRNVSNYSRVLGETYAEGDAAVVNMTFNNDSSEWGYRIVQTNDSKLNSPARPPAPANNRSTWTVVNDTDASRFIVNLNTSLTRGSNTTVRFTNDSQDFVTVSFKRTASGNLIEINTESNVADNSSGVICEPSNRRVLLDVYTGNAFTGDCSFSAVSERGDPTQTLEAPYNVTIEDGNNAAGSFSLVVNRSRRVTYNTSTSGYVLYEACDGAPSPASRDDPCRVPAVWQANMTVTYTSPNSDYWQQHNVSVYP